MIETDWYTWSRHTHLFVTTTKLCYRLQDISKDWSDLPFNTARYEPSAHDGTKKRQSNNSRLFCVCLRLSQNIFSGRGYSLPVPPPNGDTPMESRFTLFAWDLVRVVETLDVSVPIRVYRRFRDLFWTTSFTRYGIFFIPAAFWLVSYFGKEYADSKSREVLGLISTALISEHILLLCPN